MTVVIGWHYLFLGRFILSLIENISTLFDCMKMLELVKRQTCGQYVIQGLANLWQSCFYLCSVFYVIKIMFKPKHLIIIRHQKICFYPGNRYSYSCYDNQISLLTPITVNYLTNWERYFRAYVASFMSRFNHIASWWSDSIT